MSLDEMFGQLRGQQPPAPFAPAELVRRRGRQRAHRQALAAGAAVLAVAGTGTGLLALPDRPGGSVGPGPLGTSAPGGPAATASPNPTGSPGVPEPPVPTASRSPFTPPPVLTAVPETLLLQRADLGPGSWTRFQPEVFEGPQPWTWSDACSGYKSSDYPSLSWQVDVRTVGYRTGQESVVEVVELYRLGAGAANLADVAAVVAFCAAATPPPGVAPSRFTIVGAEIAGDESLLVKHEAWYYQGETLAPTPFVTYLAVVRVEDFVATVRSRDEAYVRTLALKAAARLV
ncbi:MAG TPA: hypothetical protein VFB84_11315 [Micromonosporaceae bacterium]|nr:hypothetical protein [Micromonosporaceae bacterium]